MISDRRRRASVSCLLVEDHQGDADLVFELLSTGTAPVALTHAPTLSAAMTHLSTGTIGVVLLDLHLPDASGCDVVRQLLAVAPQVPIVVLTGSDDPELGLACLKAGATDYLPKPELRAENLGRAIAFALARANELLTTQKRDELERRLAAIVGASSDLIVSTDAQGTIETWNAGAERLTGVAATAALGRPLTELIAGWREGDWEHVFTRPDGSQRVLTVVGAPIRDATGAMAAFAFIGRDVTISRKRTDELQQRETQLRALAARLTDVREAERANLSRRVHDELGQLLTGIRLDLQWLGRRVDAPALTERITEADGLVERVLEAVREIALELRPSALDALGLSAAIRDEARRFERRSQVAVEVTIDESAGAVPAEVATTLFRILQELLTNVARHAEASSAWIAMHSRQTEWELRVEDDGVGFDARAVRPSALGMLGAQERAASLGGRVELGPSPRDGALVRVTIPREGWR